MVIEQVAAEYTRQQENKRRNRNLRHPGTQAAHELNELKQAAKTKASCIPYMKASHQSLNWRSLAQWVTTGMITAITITESQLSWNVARQALTGTHLVLIESYVALKPTVTCCSKQALTDTWRVLCSCAHTHIHMQPWSLARLASPELPLGLLCVYSYSDIWLCSLRCLGVI